MRQHIPSARRASYRAARMLLRVAGLCAVTGILLTGCASHSSAPGAAAGAFASPTPAFASHGPLAQVVAPAIWGTGVLSVDTAFDQSRNSAAVTISLGGTVPHTDAETSTAQEYAKGLCFMAQQALWTSGSSFNEAKVSVQGPMRDPYGSLVTDIYAIAVVEAHTAHTISWTTATADSAWPSYDSSFLREAFTVVD